MVLFTYKIAGEIMFSVSIVMPVTDESDTLVSAVDRVLKKGNAEDICEIIFVTWDKTTPESLAALDEIIHKYPDVSITAHKQSSPGIRGALYESLYLAKGTHVAHFTGDEDTDPDVLIRMIAVSKQNPDAVVIASRWIKGGGFEGYGFFNRLCNCGFQQLLRILYGGDVHDYTYSFRIFPTESMKRISWDREGFPVVLENTLKLRRLGYSFIEVPAVWRGRSQGESRNSFLLKMKYLPVVFDVRFKKLDNLLKK